MMTFAAGQRLKEQIQDHPGEGHIPGKLPERGEVCSEMREHKLGCLFFVRGLGFKGHFS